MNLQLALTNSLFVYEDKIFSFTSFKVNIQGELLKVQSLSALKSKK